MATTGKGDAPLRSAWATLAQPRKPVLEGTDGIAAAAVLTDWVFDAGAASEAHSGAGSLTVPASLTATATKAGNGPGSLTASASLSATGRKAGRGAATLAAIAALSLTGRKGARSTHDGGIEAGAEELELQPTFGRTGRKAAFGTGSLSLSASLAATGVGAASEAHEGTGSMVLVPVLAGSGSKRAVGEGFLTLAPAFVAVEAGPVVTPPTGGYQATPNRRPRPRPRPVERHEGIGVLRLSCVLRGRGTKSFEADDELVMAVVA